MTFELELVLMVLVGVAALVCCLVVGVADDEG